MLVGEIKDVKEEKKERNTKGNFSFKCTSDRDRNKEKDRPTDR